jgi:hypothetical protein
MLNDVSSLTRPSRRCAALNRAGAECGAWAGQDSDFCLAHDPRRSAIAAEARRAGGFARGRPAPAPPADLATSAQLRRALELTIDRVRSAAESPEVARVVISAIAQARTVIADEVLEQRIAALEAAAAERAALAEKENDDE